MVRWIRGAAAVGCAVVVVGACGGVPSVGTAKPPEFQPANETKCAIVKSHSEPLVVEWPMSDRAKLETLKRTGLVAVQYEGCHMKLLPYCKAPGAYDYSGVTRKHDRVMIRNASELYASLPGGAVQLEGRLAEGGQLGVRMTVVGRYVADRPVLRADELTGDCKGATHVIAALTVGSFDFEAYGKSHAEGGIKAFGAGAGGSATAERETLSTDGTETACATAKTTDTGPPEECGAPIRVEVLELAKPEDPAKAWVTGVEQRARNIRVDADHQLAATDDGRKKLSASSCGGSDLAKQLFGELDEITRQAQGFGARSDELLKQAAQPSAAFGTPGAEALDKELTSLREQIWKLRTRSSLLTEALTGVLTSCGPGKVWLSVKNLLGPEYVLTRVAVVVDGAKIYTREDDRTRFPENIPIFDGEKMPAGEHVVSSFFEYKPKGGKIRKIVVKGSIPFRNKANEPITVSITPYDRGGAGAPLDQRPALHLVVEDSQGKTKETLEGDVVVQSENFK